MGYMKGFMQVFSDGSAILREWRTIRLLKGYMVYGKSLSRSTAKRWIDSVNDCLKKKNEVGMLGNKENGA